eukprot:3277851-Amphidinium_carterae.1
MGLAGTGILASSRSQHAISELGMKPECLCRTWSSTRTADDPRTMRAAAILALVCKFRTTDWRAHSFTGDLEIRAQPAGLSCQPYAHGKVAIMSTKIRYVFPIIDFPTPCSALDRNKDWNPLSLLDGCASYLSSHPFDKTEMECQPCV